jgi:hypothetical protein
VHTCACPLSRCRAPSQVWDAHGSIFPIFISPPRGETQISGKTLQDEPCQSNLGREASSPKHRPSPFSICIRLPLRCATAVRASHQARGTYVLPTPCTILLAQFAKGFFPVWHA